MKELYGLKVRAIAVKVPEYHQYDVACPIAGRGGTNPCIMGSFKDDVKCFDIATLPPGEWKILGRANELFVTKSCKYEILDFLPGHGWRDYEYKTPDAWCMKTQTQSWQSYCSQHGLTNELILIEE